MDLEIKNLVVAYPAHLAIIKNNQQVLQVLLSHNADINLQGENYGVLLKEASVNGKPHLMKLLASHRADVNAIGQGIPVLHEAILNRQPEAVSVLLDLGAYINILDYAQGTPLQLSKAMHYGGVERWEFAILNQWDHRTFIIKFVAMRQQIHWSFPGIKLQCLTFRLSLTVEMSIFKLGLHTISITTVRCLLAFSMKKN
ncbi:putative sex-determining protein fem-1 protein [Botrytis fragariae]|uniref:Putative sex-determining protein fem-1 protein n=1 Tax=Botrytis fragariae TaxID=1964551 RepID=A0A8H6AMV6_9HELO|nr:putative sex-determining protein fem-1 protein [Botrytis fragariae]KAF5870291.1 putative sex-determining protein fem-1 protein [Botrytis fragariae]